MQRGFRLTVSGNANNGNAAPIIWPGNIFHFAESELIVMDTNAITRFHAHIAFNAVVLAKGNTNNGNRQPDVTRDHAPVAWRQLCPTGNTQERFGHRQYEYPACHRQPHHCHGGNAIL